MKDRVVILGAGFGGLELATQLSESLGDDIDVTLIDRSDAFVFGFSKLDVLFGRTSLDKVRLPYKDFVKPGVRFVQETITSIDPTAKRVVTDHATYDADTLVIALGADYDFAATPGLAQSTEFYSVSGAQRMAGLLPSFEKGRALIAICGAPFKCPPAPSECALLLHDFLTKKGVRGACEITLAFPMATPVPPSPETSKALFGAFAERDIKFVGDVEVRSIDAARGIASFDNGSELGFDLLLGVPAHRAPDVVQATGLCVNGYVPVSPQTLETSVSSVYAIGDCATQGTPKAGVFAEGAARAVAASIIARARGGDPATKHAGKGSCYIEFGAGRIGRVDIDFLSGPKPTGTYQEPSVALRAEKETFGSTRRARWFGRS